MARILLVDDEELLRENLRDSLELDDHEVSEAENGAIARDALAAGNFDLVISDVRMPFFDGIQLLEWSRRYKPTPFILMTGFSRVLETVDAVELGADNFLAKPFSIDDLSGVVNECLEPQQSEESANEEVENLDPFFCKVSLEEFTVGKSIHFPIFIRFSNRKYLKIAHRGEDVDLTRIRQYREKGVSFLYLRKDDYADFVKFSLELAKSVGSCNKISLDRKKQFMKYTSEVVLENIFVNETDREAFVDATNFVDTSMSILFEDDQCFQLVEVLNSHSDKLYAHSLAVSIYSTMVARKLGWECRKTLYQIAISGILHDIGKKEIDREILEKTRPIMTQQERNLYESHPLRGKEILQEIPAVPSDVIQAVHQHHESCNGEGYPNRLTRQKIFPLARLIHLVDLFVHYALDSSRSGQSSFRLAVKQIESRDLEKVDPEFFNGLKRLVSKDSQTN